MYTLYSRVVENVARIVPDMLSYEVEGKILLRTKNWKFFLFLCFMSDNHGGSGQSRRRMRTDR